MTSKAVITLVQGIEGKPHTLRVVTETQRKGVMFDFDCAQEFMGVAMACSGNRRFWIGQVDKALGKALTIEVKVYNQDVNTLLAAARCAFCFLRCERNYEVSVVGWMVEEARDCSGEHRHQQCPPGSIEL